MIRHQFDPEEIPTDAYLLTDSRQLVFPAPTVFFAIKGFRHDGHQFIASLYQKGVRKFFVEKKAFDPTLLAAMPEATFWVVESSLKALQSLAQYHRNRFHLPVVGITGSNGKTIVKEWLGQLMASQERVVKSPKSYNSQIGVPLSVWPINDTHTLGIFEAGISQPHEMKPLQQIIRPDIGIFTNIGTAHDEGFRSQKQKIVEKLHLFTQCQTLIYRADYEPIDQEIKLILQSVNPTCEYISWGLAATGRVGVWWEKIADYTKIQLQSADTRFNGFVFEVPFSDEASLENITHCLLFMLFWGVSPAQITHRLRGLRSVPMRLELKEGINRCYLIDDTYNNDWGGLNIALQFLEQQHQRPQKVVILSDLLQTGQKEADLYADIQRLLTEKNIQKLIGIGDAFVRNAAVFHLPAEFYPSTQAFLDSLTTDTLKDATVLVKGARPFEFERIIQRLQQKVHGTVLEINLDALTHNLNYYRQCVGRDTRIMVMVKAFAYGSGSAEVAQLLQFHRVDYLAVAYADEGVALRQNGITLPIMVMNPAAATFDKMAEYALEPEIYSPKVWNEWVAFRQFWGEGSKAWTLPVHLKLDTGMHRLGFGATDLLWLKAQLASWSDVKIASVFSHLVGADETAHNAFSHEQARRFEEWSTDLMQSLAYQPLRHLLNSAGIVRFPQYKFDMVRLGIGLYGIEASGEHQSDLQQIGTLKTVVSQVKHLSAGETVGYSRKGLITQDATIATIAIGYADGYDRRLGQGVGQVLINGHFCPVVGNVCMDMTMVNATGVPVQEGDEVIVFGPQWPLQNLADRIGTIPYEILTGISERVKRVYYRE
ncbi:MAG: bifunctional UDP-N-acetylmuramoyl-tripeptide:D-alanyl-D-alanine ligase/alanine racemase [Runella sp.]